MMTSRELKSKVCRIANRIGREVSRGAAFREAWRIVKAGGLTMQVKGVSFGNRQEALHRLAGYAPDAVRAFIVPEPENPADPAALAVMVGVQEGRGLYRLGYVPRQETAAARALHGRLPRFSVIGGDIYGARVTLTA
jgi:hypothetical protein